MNILLVELLSPYTDIIYPVAFVLFVIGTLITFYYSADARIQWSYVTGFIAVLVVFNLVGLAVAPIVNMHKFTGTVDQEATTYEMTVVDENGAELNYDQTAAPPVIGTRHTHLAEDMVTEYDEQRQQAIATHLLDKATNHREDIESGSSPLERVHYPGHMDVDEWDREELADYDEFETIRIYETTIIYNDDSSGIEERTKTLRLEVTPTSGETAERGGS